MNTTATHWNNYAKDRLLERNRLTLEHHQDTVRGFIDYFKKVNIDSKVLDIACGGGFFLENLRNLGFNDIQGLDLSKVFVDRAKSKNLNVNHGNIFDLDFESEFDYILCMEIFEHLDHIPVERLSKALKPGGILFVTVPVYDSLKHQWERKSKKVSKLSQAQKHDPTHLKDFCEKDLLKLITESNYFRIKHTQHFYNPMPFVPYRTIWKFTQRLTRKGMFLMATFENK